MLYEVITVIVPDALALTSNGTVGTGSEASVRGAKILLSTKTANRIIADVYAVRSDYFRSRIPLACSPSRPAQRNSFSPVRSG